MKKLFVLAALVGTIATVNVKADNLDFYNQIADDLEIVQIYDVDDLDYETLTNRNGNIIIEKIIGIVLDEAGNGEILNTNTEYNYINYQNVKDARIGDIVLTYCIFNPDTNYEDDIIDRMDYIIDRTGAE